MSKPTIVLVPGAWHMPDAYTALIDPLKAAGYPVVGITLSSAIAPGSTPVPNFDEDVKSIRAAVTGAAEVGQDVVVLMHSYGGLPACDAVKGLSKDERGASGKQGGVTRMVFLCAFAAEVGVCLMDMLGGQWLPWWTPDGDKVIKCIDTEKIFYNDLPPDSPVIPAAQAGLLRQSEGAMWSKATYAAWKDIPSVYIICDQDAAIPPPAQQGMASQPGKWLDSINLDAGHIPFLAKPKETEAAVRKACGENLSGV